MFVFYIFLILEWLSLGSNALFVKKKKKDICLSYFTQSPKGVFQSQFIFFV